MDIPPRSKVCLIPFTGASLIGLQHWSNIQTGKRREKRIENGIQDNLGKRFGKDQVSDLACLVFLPVCTAALAEKDAETGRIRPMRDGVRNAIWKVVKPGNAAKATMIFAECPKRTWWKCEKDSTSITGGSWSRDPYTEPSPEKFVKAVLLEGKCKNDK